MSTSTTASLSSSAMAAIARVVKFSDPMSFNRTRPEHGSTWRQRDVRGCRRHAGTSHPRGRNSTTGWEDRPESRPSRPGGRSPLRCSCVDLRSRPSRSPVGSGSESADVSAGPGWLGVLWTPDDPSLGNGLHRRRTTLVRRLHERDGLSADRTAGLHPCAGEGRLRVERHGVVLPLGGRAKAWRSPRRTRGPAPQRRKSLAFLWTASRQGSRRCRAHRSPRSPSSNGTRQILRLIAQPSTSPHPRTRSLMPIVLIRRRAVPVGDRVPARRMGAPGAAIKATPTDVRSHPIEPIPISTTR